MAPAPDAVRHAPPGRPCSSVGATAALHTLVLIPRPQRHTRGGHGDYLTETSMVAWNALRPFDGPAAPLPGAVLLPVLERRRVPTVGLLHGTAGGPAPGGGGRNPCVAVKPSCSSAELTASGVLTYFLAHAVTGAGGAEPRRGPALRAFFPNRMDHLGQFTCQQAVLLPVIVWAVYRFVRRAVARRHLWPGCRSRSGRRCCRRLYNGYALLIPGRAGRRRSWYSGVSPDRRAGRSSVGAAAAGGILRLALAAVPVAVSSRCTGSWASSGRWPRGRVRDGPPVDPRPRRVQPVLLGAAGWRPRDGRRAACSQASWRWRWPGRRSWLYGRRDGDQPRRRHGPGLPACCWPGSGRRRQSGRSHLPSSIGQSRTGHRDCPRAIRVRGSDAGRRPRCRCWLWAALALARRAAGMSAAHRPRSGCSSCCSCALFTYMLCLAPTLIV